MGTFHVPSTVMGNSVKGQSWKLREHKFEKVIKRSLYVVTYTSDGDKL